MKIVTWNVNSVHARLPRVSALLARHQPDLVCLQEIKTGSEEFPAGDCAGWMRSPAGCATPTSPPARSSSPVISTSPPTTAASMTPTRGVGATCAASPSGSVSAPSPRARSVSVSHDPVDGEEQPEGDQ